MSATRLFSVVALLLAACAGWDSSPPANSPPPPADGAVPSHYAPPPPSTGPSDAPPEAPKNAVKIAIASVQLIQDCPDPAAATQQAPAGEMSASPAGAAKPVVDPPARGKMSAGAAAQSRMGPGGTFHQPCTQSTVQLAVHASNAGVFRVEAVRLFEAASGKLAGAAKLRGPTAWSDDSGYSPWDERLKPGAEQKISYKLGEPDFSAAGDKIGPPVSTMMPLILELEVSVDGVRQTIRSAEFSREPPHMVVT